MPPEIWHLQNLIYNHPQLATIHSSAAQHSPERSVLTRLQDSHPLLCRGAPGNPGFELLALQTIAFHFA